MTYSKDTCPNALKFILFVWLLLFSVKLSLAQSVQCLSENPADWPAPAKPYYLVIADTSGSMTACTNPTTDYPATCASWATPNSCGLTPTRYNDLKCSLYQATSAYAGQANFGLMTFAAEIDSCPENCFKQCNPGDSNCAFETYGCALNCTDAEQTTNGTCSGCGPKTGDSITRAGGILRVPITTDNFWEEVPLNPSNAQDLLGWVDNSCGGDSELFAAGATPLNGALRDAKRYLQSGWIHPDNPSISFPTPMDLNDPPCRDVNVILITDGDETCDSQTDAENAAATLLVDGITVGTNVFNVETYVINFAGGTQTNTDAIAVAGGTGASFSVSNEVQLSQALSKIISVTDNETCDNADNNCNGCIDEGFLHYANVNQTCCVWASTAERDSCISNYKNSFATSPPLGDRALLPCTTPSQQEDPSTWLCYNPGEQCDAQDNNGQTGVDEDVLQCGSPLHCPTTEICNGLDDDCDGVIDDENVCGDCIPSMEVCDGCDNDCDGVIDNGAFPLVDCGLSDPGFCTGKKTCASPQSVTPGECILEGGYGSCSNNPGTEICDGIDNNCSQIIDEDLQATDCEPPGTTAGLIFGGNSQCRKGTKYCGQSCSGFIGPTSEVSDGVDNDCNGIIDDGPLILLDVSIKGGGIVTSQPVGINCGVDCTESFIQGTEITLTATPNTQASFAGWEGDCSGTETCIITLNTPSTITATFNNNGMPWLMLLLD